MQILNGVLSSIKTFNTFPPQIVKNIPFHFLTEAKRIKVVELQIRTAGGECRKSLTNSFTLFFENAGVLDQGERSRKGHVAFVWDKDYFPEEETEDCEGNRNA